MPALSESEWTALILSLKTAGACTAVVCVPGTLCGWLIAKKHFPGRTLLICATHVPLVVPPVVIGYLLLLILGRNGVIGSRLDDWFGWNIAFTWYAAVIASAIVAFPLIVRSVSTSVSLIDPGIEDAAATLGAGPVRRFLTIILPGAMPGVLAGMMLAFARSLGEFGATMTFAGNLSGETRTLSLAVYTAMQTTDGDSVVARLAVLSILLSFMVLAASEVMLKKSPNSRTVRGRRAEASQ